MLQVPGLENPHTHLREGEVVGPLVVWAIRGGARSLGPMPNTEHGLMKAMQVDPYILHAKSFVPQDTVVRFIPIVQITEATTKADIEACVDAGIMDAKVYPKGRTTQSHNGVSHYARILDIVRYAGERGMRVHFHPEHPSNVYDNRDAEFAFLAIVDMFIHETGATIVWEHGTDGRCIPHWEAWAETGRFYVTFTGHHLAESENGAYGDVGAACKPPYKTEADRRGLVDLVARDYPWVMAGGDDAPHPTGSKHRIGQCACGAYTAPFLMQLYAHALDKLLSTQGGIRNFIRFTSENAQQLYGHTSPGLLLKLVRKPFKIPSHYDVGPWEVEPFWAGKEILYSLV